MQHHTINIDNISYNLCIKKSRLAKRMILKYNLKKHELIATIPNYVTYNKALEFVNDNASWVKNNPHITPPLDFEQCKSITLIGKTYSILDEKSVRNTYNINHTSKIITIYYKNIDNRAKLLLKCLKAIALDVFRILSENKSLLLGVKYNSVSIMDQKKWGSCSIDGKLKYNFRVVMAPLHVIDYLVAHEVAHLKEFNHSKNFWHIVSNLYCYDNINLSKQWLKNFGHTLY